MNAWNHLAAYVQSHDEAAFAKIVQEHIGLVHSAALRCVHDRTAAEEITQQVFILLAKKAGSLKPTGSLGAWLYRSTCLIAKDHQRNERTRRRWEEQARTMNEKHEENEIPWSEIAPILDEAMESLGEEDRAAVLMRYFEGRRLQEIASTLELSEEAARKRVSRALERLRRWFARRGVACSSGALGVALSASAVSLAPETLAQSTLRAALAQGASSISNTTLLASMATMKLPLVAACLASAAVPISLGYLSQPVSAPSASLTAEEVLPKIELTLPDTTESALMAEWRDLRQAHGPDAGSMARLYEAVASIDDDFRRRAFRTALLTEWTAIDPQGAVDYFAEKSESRTKVVLRGWLERDPSAALAHMRAEQETLSEAISDLLGDLATTHPGVLAEFAPLVKAENPWEKRVQEAFAAAARNDLDGMRATAEGMTGQARREALAGIALAWAEHDGPAALEWAQSMDSSEDRSRAMRSLLVGWAKSDVHAALDHLHLAPAGGGQMATLNTETAEHVLRAAAEADFENTMAWLNDHPNEIKGNGWHGLTKAIYERLRDDLTNTLATLRDHRADKLMDQVLTSVLMNDGSGQRGEVWSWLRNQDLTPFVAELKESVLRIAAWQAPDDAIRWASELMEHGESLGMDDSQLATYLMDNGSDFHRVEGMLEKMPEALKPAFLSSAFAHLPEASVDLAIWKERLTLLEPGKRPSAVRSLAKAQVASDPEGAQAWADTLAGEERHHAYEGMAKGWAQADSYGASQWIAGLGEGEARDHSVQALVSVIAKDDPNGAWEWAQTIQTAEPRLQALQEALRGLGERGLEALSQANLSPNEKTELQKVIAP